jgi:tRNA A-37 threonylcarbamoyl transferase component Bud32
MTSSARDLERRIVLCDRYTLVRAIATGGMAEIFLARQKALYGLEKDVVVKLLRDRYRSDPRVVEMFVNEAKIGAVLNHPNVVHFYDYGEHERQPFIVMEHIDGDELSQLCRRGLELAKFLPLEHAVDLIRQAAEALGHFHAKREPGTEHPLDIVHRDISPSNFIITRDGVLKVIDFGIARANWSAKKGEEDKLVPGKYNYMSPEQVRGERVDARSDIFSLGIVLYEITVGKRLFKGRPEEVIQKITRGRIKPPTFIRRQFPPALEAIVMRALETHKDDRYASAYELANDLEEFLRTANLKSGPIRIAQYLDELRAAEGGERRPELIIAGEAWLDDDGEEALDFDRGFSAQVPAAAPRATTAAGVAKPAPAAPAAEKPAEKPSEKIEKLIEKLEAKAEAPAVAPEKDKPTVRLDKVEASQSAPPVTPVDEDEKTAKAPEANAPISTFEDEEAQTHVAEEALSRTAPIRPERRAEEVDLDPELGDDSPTDASLNLPEMDADGIPRELTTPMLLAEPTGRVPLAHATAKYGRVAGIAVPLGEAKSRPSIAVPLQASLSGSASLRPPLGEASRVPLMAPTTGKVPLATPVPSAAPASLPLRAERPAALPEPLDPSSSMDTPLPPIIDPAIDDTARHPLAEPLREHLAAAGSLKLLRAEPSQPNLPKFGDSMSLTIPAETPKRAPARGKGGRGTRSKRSSRGYQARAFALQTDPTPAPTFGDGILAIKQKRSLPWPVIGGAAALLILLSFLLLR